MLYDDVCEDIIIQYNTIQKFVVRTLSVSWQHRRCGQSPLKAEK